MSFTNFKEDQVIWIDNNLELFRQSKQPSVKEQEMVYSIYNHIFNQKKKMSSCGRCWNNTKRSVYTEYNRLKNIF